MSTLMPEPALSTSEEDAIGPSSSDSEDDEIDQFQDNASRRVAIAFQHTDIYEFPPKE